MRLTFTGIDEWMRNPEDLERPIRRKVNTESGEVEQQIRDVEHRIRGS